MDLRFNPYRLYMGAKPKPEKFTLPVLLTFIKTGKVRIPNFQRDLVWKRTRIESLLDSISKGYPIGFILLWATKEKLEEHDPLKLNLPKSKNEKLYLLDGQQRLITLFGILNNQLVLGKTEYRGFYNLKNGKFRVVKKSDIGKKFIIEDRHIPMDEVIKISYKTQEYKRNEKTNNRLRDNQDFLNKYDNLYDAFKDLEIPAVIVSKDVGGATESYERLNTRGIPLKVVDIMIAKTYNKNKFHLKKKLKEYEDKLFQRGFELDSITILQCMAACISHGTGRNYIFKTAEKRNLERKWDKTINAINLSIDFIQNIIPIPSKFLPHRTALAPLSYFFYRYGNKRPPQEITDTLKRYFWLSAFSGRYIKSQDTKAREDIKSMHELFKNSNYSLFDWHVVLDSASIKETQLKLTSPRAKAILCLLASKEPLEFGNSRTKVKLMNEFADTNAKSMHHVFSLNLYKKEPLVNSVANISLISIGTNNSLKDRRPSDYFEEFKNKNSSLQTSLLTHLIGDFDEFGISKDNFTKFIDKRADSIKIEIDKLVEELKPTSPMPS